ncbi:ribonuclease H2 subunit B isoform X2 [Thrips palmi]|uniref:Ribonuclease H2 subunit B n=1 Tax=Thrips palmi TaxID=161013 RepID=A0A6P8ZL72_THRPL|nr:ribonuclease H2 subunit B isoform X2 [Thrips palmi]
MPRVKSSPSKCVKTKSGQYVSTWYFLVKGKLIDHSGHPLDIVKLRHPATGESSMFLFSPKEESIQEVLTFSENKRSWFVNDTVNEDGKLLLSTPFDPLFLVVPYLAKATATVPLDQLLQDDQFPQNKRLLQCAGMKHLSEIADRKGDPDINAYKFNEEKLMIWLEKKIERLTKVLQTKNVNVTGGSVSATFVQSSTGQAPKEAYLKYAHGIMSEFLPEDLGLKFYHHLKLPPEEAPGMKRKSVVTPDQKDPKKMKLDDGNNDPALIPVDDSPETQKAEKSGEGLQ